MAPYLSPAWLDDLNATARSDARLRASTGGARVVIQQVVTGPPVEARYWVRVDDGVVEVGPGDAERPDATVTQSYGTAAAVSRGELAVEDAILAGRTRLSGDIGVLVRHQGALQSVAAALDAVRGRTTYD